MGSARASFVSRTHPLELLAENRAYSKLRELVIHPGEPGWDEPDIRLEGLQAIVNSSNLTGLEQLRLLLTDMGDESSRVIVDSAILRHFISYEVMKLLSELLIEVHICDQQNETPDDRYVVIGE